MTEPESVKELVAALYRGILRREPDAAGLAAYSEQIITGRMSVSAALESLLASEEYNKLRHPIVAGEGAVTYRAPGAKHEKRYETIDHNTGARGSIIKDYMKTANCVSFDFFCPEFEKFCHSINHPVILHRKLWEFAFITHHLAAKGALRRDAKGVGFGVGREPLPSLFASLGCKVLATDAPIEVINKGWSETKQHSQSRESLFFPQIVSEGLFERNVTFAAVDMNAIDESIGKFDFCWSACCFEHLGTLESGLAFVEASVEKLLEVGGVACHTSELNLSSNTETVEAGETVLYRQEDI